MIKQKVIESENIDFTFYIVFIVVNVEWLWHYLQCIAFQGMECEYFMYLKNITTGESNYHYGCS